MLLWTSKMVSIGFLKSALAQVSIVMCLLSLLKFPQPSGFAGARILTLFQRDVHQFGYFLYLLGDVWNH